MRPRPSRPLSCWACRRWHVWKTGQALAVAPGDLITTLNLARALPQLDPDEHRDEADRLLLQVIEAQPRGELANKAKDLRGGIAARDLRADQPDGLRQVAVSYCLQALQLFEDGLPTGRTLSLQLFCQAVASCASEASSWGSISRRSPFPLDYRQLFKLRLVVAAMGETQRLGWWNSGVLKGTGEFLFQQGFPRSKPFAQTRAGFRVAKLACDGALAIQPSPGGPITCHLFRLTPQLEDALEKGRKRWLDGPQEWARLYGREQEEAPWMSLTK